MARESDTDRDNAPGAPEDAGPAAPAPATAAPSAAAPSAAIRPGRGLAILALLLALLALLGVAALAAWWQLQPAPEAARAEDPRALQQLRDEFAQWRSARHGGDERLREELRALAAQQRERDARLEQLGAGQAELARRLSPEQRGYWQLAEAEYLMQVAEQRLLMLRDPRGSLRLLRAADERLRRLDDAGLYPVRERLAADIAALAAIEVPDIEGLYLRLRAQAQSAGQLPLHAPLALLPATDAATAETWRQRLWQVIGRLGDQVRVRRRDVPVEPLLDAEQERLLQLRLQLQFEQAGAALLAGHEAAFRDTLERIDAQLQHFAGSAPEASAAIGEALAALAAQPLQMALPDISGARRALRDWMDERQRESQS